MTYSINIRANSKAAARDIALTALRKQLEQQPAHADDSGSILASVEAGILSMSGEPGEDIIVEAWGSTDYKRIGDRCRVEQHLRIYRAPALIPA